MIKKLICSLLVGISIIAAYPAGAYAEWRNNTSGWWYEDGNSYYTGWKQLDGKWYHFKNNGYMDKGWIKDRAWWYYLQDSGVMATGKLDIKDKLYEFDNSGKWINNSLPKKIISEKITNNSMSITTKPSENKLKSTPDFSWFGENGNTYFKVTNKIFAYGGWNIDGEVYVFDSNGVLQKGEYIGEDGSKYLLGDDGKFIKGITNESDELWAQGALTTKSNTNNFEVELDDSHIMDLDYVDSDQNGVKVKDKTVNELDSIKTKPMVEGKTLYCKTNQSISLGTIKVKSTDSNSLSFPNLALVSTSTDDKIVYSGVDLSLEDGFYRNIHPKVIAYKPGKATVTIDVNGAKTSFDIVVSE